MKIEDLKYITPIDINAAHLNVTSAEMYEEAKNFNQHMYDMQRKRHRFNLDMMSIIVFNIIVFAVGCGTAICSYTSLMFYLTGGRGFIGGNVHIAVIPAVIYAIAFVYVILIRKVYDWRVILAFSFVPMFTSYAFIPLAIGNVLIIRNAKQIDDEIKGEPGYPGFAELVLSYIRDEENAEEGSMNGYSDSEKSDDLESERKENPFDKYRTRYQDGGGLLKDNDISSVINDKD